ncbi:hypothetical protein C4D60_Mb06t10970 [Musa balbisiana]|uniref:Uncharacterized protein n=1 Tax=Musa balbisiana TaxID=52838 RepID=A0A4S8INH8_MUSBA|nr:hypothetical protein C4D60_Mb06t10970 [Musa balbisiana]
MSSVDSVECSSNCLGGNCDAIAIIPLHLNQLKPKHPLWWLFACKKLRNGYIFSVQLSRQHSYFSCSGAAKPVPVLVHSCDVLTSELSPTLLY